MKTQRQLIESFPSSKVCRGCGLDKKLEEFPPSSDGCKYGRLSQCRGCMRERSKEHYSRRRDEYYKGRDAIYPRTESGKKAKLKSNHNARQIEVQWLCILCHKREHYPLIQKKKDLRELLSKE